MNIKNAGRKKIEIDKNIFEELCNIHCIKNEICSVLNCNEQTLTRWCKDTYNKGFADVYSELSAGGKISLRRMQFETAKKGNVAMLIWLGKQFLGQVDKVENKNIEEAKKYNINVNFAGRAANK